MDENYYRRFDITEEIERESWAQQFSKRTLRYRKMMRFQMRLMATQVLKERFQPRYRHRPLLQLVYSSTRDVARRAAA